MEEEEDQQQEQENNYKLNIMSMNNSPKTLTPL